MPLVTVVLVEGRSDSLKWVALLLSAVLLSLSGAVLTAKLEWQGWIISGINMTVFITASWPIKTAKDRICSDKKKRLSPLFPDQVFHQSALLRNSCKNQLPEN